MAEKELITIELPIVETERIQLRKLKMEDAFALLGVYADPEVSKLTADNTVWSSQRILDYVKSTIVSDAIPPNLRDSIDFAIIERGTNRLVGMNYLFRDENTPPKEYERAIRLRKDAQGQKSESGLSFAQEAQLALMEYGFTKLHLDKITTRCDPNNIPSEKGILKTGMRFTHEVDVDQDILKEYKRKRASKFFEITSQEWITFKEVNKEKYPVLQPGRIKIN